MDRTLLATKPSRSPLQTDRAAMPDSEERSPEEWVDLYGDSLYRFAISQVHDRDVAEDLVQETLLAALQSRDRFEGRSSQRTWLTSILKYKLIDHFRKSQRTRTVDVEDVGYDAFDEPFLTTGEWVGHWKADGAPGEWPPDPHRALEQKEFWEVFQVCLDDLPPRAARAFWLREVDGLGTDDICKEIECTATNLWVMLHRARMQLRRSLEERWFGKAGKPKQSYATS